MDEAIQAALATDNLFKLEEQRSDRRQRQSRAVDVDSEVTINKIWEELKGWKRDFSNRKHPSELVNQDNRDPVPTSGGKQQRLVSATNAVRDGEVRSLRETGLSRLRSPGEGWTRTRAQERHGVSEWSTFYKTINYKLQIRQGTSWTLC